MSSKYKIELQHITDENNNIIFTYDDLILYKNDDLDLFNIRSLNKIIIKIIGRKVNTKIFLLSYRFYLQLAQIDKTLQKYNFVYLRIIDSSKKICKIGRTYNINRRYDTSAVKTVDMLIPVTDDIKVESLLIKRFTDEFKRIGKSKETFKYKNLKVTKELFKNICRPFEIKTKIKETEHIKTLITKQHHSEIHVSIEVCDIIFNNYVNDNNYIQKFDTMKQYIINSMNKDEYMCSEYNKLLKTKCLYWKYHKYTVIQNESDLYINGSRLWNSVIKNDGIKKKTKLSKFLKLKYIQDIIKEFRVIYPGQEPYRKEIINKEQPYFSGIYIHYALVHFMLAYLNARYALTVSELMYRLYHNNYLNKISKNKKSISGGRLLMTRDEYNENYLKHYKNINNLHMFIHVLALDE